MQLNQIMCLPRMSNNTLSSKLSKIWQPKFTAADYEIVTETKHYDGIITLLERQLRFRMFDGSWSSTITRTSITRNSAIAVLLYQPEQDVVILVEQFRVGGIEGKQSPWILEPVAGMIENGYSAVDTAHKEAKEESGCDILELIPIGKYLASPGISNEVTLVYCGRINAYTSGSVHGVDAEHENIKVHAMPVAQALTLLEAGEILAVGTVVCLQWLKINYIQLRQRWGSI